eukprot:1886892-Rhodomonas_salina.1
MAWHIAKVFESTCLSPVIVSVMTGHRSAKTETRAVPKQQWTTEMRRKKKERGEERARCIKRRRTSEAEGRRRQGRATTSQGKHLTREDRYLCDEDGMRPIRRAWVGHVLAAHAVPSRSIQPLSSLELDIVSTLDLALRFLALLIAVPDERREDAVQSKLFACACRSMSQALTRLTEREGGKGGYTRGSTIVLLRLADTGPASVPGIASKTRWATWWMIPAGCSTELGLSPLSVPAPEDRCRISRFRGRGALTLSDRQQRTPSV